jgi:hypothetical protein
VPFPFGEQVKIFVELDRKLPTDRWCWSFKRSEHFCRTFFHGDPPPKKIGDSAFPNAIIGGILWMTHENGVRGFKTQPRPFDFRLAEESIS